MWSRLTIAIVLLASAACSSVGVEEANSADDLSTAPPTGVAETEPPQTTTLPDTTSVPSISEPHHGDPRLEFTYGARQNYLPRVTAHWVGLPSSVDRVTIDPAYYHLVEERKIEGNVTFEFTKPEWTSYFTFTAYDAEGTAIASEEAVIDGSGCSARSHRPGGPNVDLPDSVEIGRASLLDATEQCLFGAVAELAASDGEFFGLEPSELGTRLKELDRRHATMNDIRVALQLPGRAETRDGVSVYVFDSDAVEILFSSDGRWIGAST